MRLPLLLDVDGVINVSPRPGRRLPFNVDVHEDVVADDGHAYTLRIRPEVRDWLAMLAERFEIVWCTTWSAAANRRISPLVGLPGDLDVVPLGSGWPLPPISVKALSARRWAANRGATSLAWIDDEASRAAADALTATWRPYGSQAWQEERDILNTAPPMPGPFKVIRTDEDRGLTLRHVRDLLAWADEQS